MKQAFTAVICSLNSKYIHSSLAPWYLTAAAELYCDNEIPVRVIEGTINEPVNAVADRVLSVDPQAVGFCSYIWNISAVKILSRIVKGQDPSCIIILGGPEVSFNADQILREESCVDYIISGEGEKPFALLLDSLRSGKDVRGIPGVCYRSDTKIVTASPNISCEDPPSPYTRDYFDTLNGRIAYLETSRGCPYSCAFCLSGRCGQVRYFDIERTYREIILLANSGTRTIKLVDRTFNANHKRANEIIRFIIDRYGKAIPRGVCFHFEVAGDILHNDTIDLFKNAPAGSIQLEIGIQSFNERTLGYVTRKTDIGLLKNNIRKLTSLKNIHIHVDLIAGLPYEDINSFEISFNFTYDLHANVLQLGFLKLLHGSAMREDPERYPCRYSEEPPYEVLETPWLTSSEIMKLHRTEDALERLHNSGRFGRTLEYVLRQTADKPFELFSKFGAYCAGRDLKKISLDAFTALAFDYFCQLDRIDKTALRDAMVCDRLSTNPSGKLPAVLRVEDPALKKAISEAERIRPRKGGKRGYALLYSVPCLVYAEYSDKDPVTGMYPLFQIPADAL